MSREPRLRWGSLSIALHWLIVALFLMLAISGLLMAEMRLSPDKVKVYALHKSFGLTVLALMAVRLCWRWIAGRPVHLPNASNMQRRLAAVTQALLYGLLIVLPLSGWFFNSASRFPLQWFGLFHVPELIGADPQFKETARAAHSLLFWITAALVTLHTAAALWHHLVKRDETLIRILPRWAAGKSRENIQ